jgi:hypothetical protein
LLSLFFLETKTQARGDSFGSTVVTYIHAPILVTLQIITDQDKGQKNAIAEYLKSAGHFHCLFHRWQNIIKMCGVMILA